MNQRRVCILGATGSIGRQALEVCAQFPSRLKVVGLAAGSSWEDVGRQLRAHKAEAVALAQPEAASRLRLSMGQEPTRILAGSDGILDLLEEVRPDVVLSAMVGAAGLPPTMRALEMGIDVALANKETLVAAGGPVMDLARRSGGAIIPVDSEHSAIFQCLEGRKPDQVDKLWLTASGGPFLRLSPGEMASVSPQQAVRHPRWSMGQKISVDSATLMNKGLEVIEACWLFDVGVDRVEVVVHPQSIVHSMVELVDGAFLAHLGPTDMRLAIQYALSYPSRWEAPWSRGFDPRTMESLHFEAPDLDRFPCLRLAYQAARIGGTLPAVLNAANEVAVQRFLEGSLAFPDIGGLVEEIMEQHQLVESPDLDQIIAADQWARSASRQWRSEQ